MYFIFVIDEYKTISAPEYTPGLFQHLSTPLVYFSTWVHPWFISAPEYTPGLFQHLSTPLVVCGVLAAQSFVYFVIFVDISFSYFVSGVRVSQWLVSIVSPSIYCFLSPIGTFNLSWIHI